MGNYRSQSAHISDWVRIGLLTKLLQLGDQLQNRLLTHVIGISLLRRVIREKMQLMTHDAFDQRLGVQSDNL